MRQNCVSQNGQGGGQGRCGQGQGKGRGQGGGRCGQGQGQGMRQAGAVGTAGAMQNVTGQCVCPKCGQTLPHTPGNACVNMLCPACGAAMARQ